MTILTFHDLRNLDMKEWRGQPFAGMTWGAVYNRYLKRGHDNGSAAYEADQWEKRQDLSRWRRCPSTHCERRQECSSPQECIALSQKAKPMNEPSAERYCGQRTDLNDAEKIYVEMLISVRAKLGDTPEWGQLKWAIVDELVRISRYDEFLRQLDNGHRYAAAEQPDFEGPADQTIDPKDP